MFTGHVNNKFFTVIVNLNMTRIINELELSNSNMTQLAIV